MNRLGRAAVSPPRNSVYPKKMENKPPADDSKNRFAEVIRKSQQRRQELNEKAKKKQMEDIEVPVRDEETPEPEENEPGV
jgi:hypothetical protein